MRSAAGGWQYLFAPPGSGKSTLVPLHLHPAPWWGYGTVVLLEPRRLAARAMARRMASLLGEEAGGIVGYPACMIRLFRRGRAFWW